MERSKIVSIAAAVVVVGIAAGLGWKAKGSFAKAKADMDQVAVEDGNLQRIYRSAEFPSKENVQRIKETVADFEASRSVITGELARCNVLLDTTKTSPANFEGELVDARKELLEKAPVINGKKAVTAEFAFGFDAYLGKESVMPNATEVPLLSQQLTIISRLVEEMYAAEVNEITKIQRSAKDAATLTRGDSLVPAVKAAAEEEETPRRGKKRNRKNKKSSEPPPPLFTSQAFAIEFTATQSSLVTLLNSFATKTDLFIVTKNITVKKAGSDFRTPPKVGDDKAEEKVSEEDDSSKSKRSTARRGRASRRSSRDKAETETAEVVVPTSSPLPAEARIKYGPDVDSPLAVRIEIDVYNFGKETK